MLKKLFLALLFSHTCAYSLDYIRTDQPIVHEQGFIKTTKAELWYEKYFMQDTQSKVPLICLHGGPGIPHDYLLPLQKLANQNPVIFYDQSGCGKSKTYNQNVEWNFEHYAQELTEFIETLGYNKIYLFGHSWGAALAIDFAAKNSDKVVGLVLASPLFDTKQWVIDNQKYIAQLPDELRVTITECELKGNTDSPEYHNAMLHFYNKHVCRHNPWPQLLQDSFSALNMTIYQKMWGPSEFTVTGNLISLNLRNQLKKLLMPTLITCGKFDEAFPETMESLVKELPYGQLNIFQDSSHTAHLEESEEYVEVVKNFLSARELIETTF